MKITLPSAIQVIGSARVSYSESSSTGTGAGFSGNQSSSRYSKGPVQRQEQRSQGDFDPEHLLFKQMLRDELNSPEAHSVRLSDIEPAPDSRAKIHSAEKAFLVDFWA